MKIITTDRFRSLCQSVGTFVLVFGGMMLVFGIVCGLVVVTVDSLTVWITSSHQLLLGDATHTMRTALALCINGFTGSFFWFCLTLRGLLRSYAQGLYFAPAITRAYLRLAGMACAIWFSKGIGSLVLLQMPVSPPLSGVNMIFKTDLSELFLAAILLILARVMEEGARVQEEQNLTV